LAQAGRLRTDGFALATLETLAARGDTATASDLAKANHADIALLASLGCITCLTRDGVPTRAWRVTYIGHTILEDLL